MKKRGFTLIEITIALLIIGLFLHLLTANWGALLSQGRLESEAKMVKAFIELARDEAVNRCTKVELVFSKCEIKAVVAEESEKSVRSLALESGVFNLEGEERVYIDELGKISGRIPPLSYEGKSVEFKIVNPLLGIVAYEIK